MTYWDMKDDVDFLRLALNTLNELGYRSAKVKNTIALLEKRIEFHQTTTQDYVDTAGTQQKLADVLGVTQQAIHLWARDNSMPLKRKEVAFFWKEIIL